MKLIFAQGNPDSKYDRTRHNIGFSIIDEFARQNNIIWSDKSKFNASVAELTMAGEKVLLVKPTTFYNETGISARKLIDFYNLDPATELLVIHDDLALPLGTIRTRAQGSDAGNNGIKSLNTHVGADYHRVRVGIWNELRDRMNDADFVLGKFSKVESDKLKTDIAPHVLQRIAEFIEGSLITTSHKI